MMTKHRLYVAKAALTEISIAVALWELEPSKLTIMGVVAVIVRALLQMCNASGAYKSDPNGSGKPNGNALPDPHSVESVAAPTPTPETKP